MKQTLLASITLFLLAAVGCQQPSPPPTASTPARLIRVNLVKPAAATVARTTTQPATIHAYYAARIFAKTSGYLIELNADIGSVVKQHDVLGVIGVPEMAKQRDAKLALIQQLQAEEQRTASQLEIAKARVLSFLAKLSKAKAEVGKAEAGLAATQVELDRVSSLVQQRAVADRLQDEAQKKHDMATAEKTSLDASVTSAEADAALAKAEVAAADADVIVAAAMTAVARSELAELDELIKYATLTAPFAGVVTQRNVDPGDLVRNAQTTSTDVSEALFVIAQLDRVRVRVHVPERDAPLANVGDPVSITLQAIPNTTFDGKIDRIAGALDERTRTMMVEIDVPNDERLLRPGMFGQAAITLAPAGDVVALPARAVRYDGDGRSFVYALNAADEVEVIDVVTGFDNGQEIEIARGIDAKTRVVGPLIDRLKPGQKVKVDS